MSAVIITFNIGGKTYQVSKHLLSKHPSTMLCMVASEIETNNHDEPIFIDGNSERFPYILDYMRFQQVELPDHIGKDTFLIELDYYEFQDIKCKKINTLSQKIKCRERMNLVAWRCIDDMTPLMMNRKRKSADVTDPICIHHGLEEKNINNIERELHIILDSKHEEHDND